jgi:hypothetical protein
MQQQHCKQSVLPMLLATIASQHFVTDHMSLQSCSVERSLTKSKPQNLLATGIENSLQIKCHIAVYSMVYLGRQLSI